MKKVVIVLMGGLLLMLIVIIILFHPLVLMGRNIYFTDVTELRLDFSVTNYTDSLYKLKYFKKLSTLHIYGAKLNLDSKAFPHDNSIKTLIINYSIIDGIPWAEDFIELDTMHCFKSKIDFNEMTSLNAKIVDLNDCNLLNIANLSMRLEQPSILRINKCTFDGISICDDRLILEDSSVFSLFKTVNELQITGIDVVDVSGFLDMNNLYAIYFDEGKVSEKNINILSDNGIEVYLLNGEEYTS